MVYNWVHVYLFGSTYFTPPHLGCVCVCLHSALQFRDTIPGPGSYGKGGDPWSQLEERYQRSPGTVGMLDNGGAVLRKLPTTVSGRGNV